MSSGVYIEELQYHRVIEYALNRFHAGKPSYTVNKRYHFSQGVAPQLYN
jgi:hypothetical protein